MALPPAPMLDWSQLAEVCELNVEIGAHSHTHPQLDTLPPSAIAHEVLQSKRFIQRRCGPLRGVCAAGHGGAVPPLGTGMRTRRHK